MSEPKFYLFFAFDKKIFKLKNIWQQPEIA